MSRLLELETVSTREPMVLQQLSRDMLLLKRRKCLASAVPA